jgi:hypothetical protein
VNRWTQVSSQHVEIYCVHYQRYVGYVFVVAHPSMKAGETQLTFLSDVSYSRSDRLKDRGLSGGKCVVGKASDL